MTLDTVVNHAAHLVLLVALGPLFAGLVRLLAARLTGRRGPALGQPYRDVMRHLTTRATSPAFAIPLAAIAIAASCGAALTLPALGDQRSAHDTLLFVGLLSLGRAATGLACIGGRRTGAVLALGRDLARMLATEPAILLALLAAGHAAGRPSGALSLTATALAGVALALATWVTTHRHEPWAPTAGIAPPGASPLEATTLIGPPRGFLELAADLRQVTLWVAWLYVFVPWSVGEAVPPTAALAAIGAGLAAIAAAVAVAEVRLVRGRLLDAGGVPAVAMSLSAVALVLAVIGGR